MLEEKFNTATFESAIVGDSRPFNAVQITHSSPAIGGMRISVIAVSDDAYPSNLETATKTIMENGEYIAEIIYPESHYDKKHDDYRCKTKYAALSKSDVQNIEAVDYDPSNDAAYAREILKLFADKI